MLLFLTADQAFGVRIVKRLQVAGVIARLAKPDVGASLCRLRDTGGILLDGRVCPNAAQELCLELLADYPDLPIALLLPRDFLLEAPIASVFRGEFDEDRLTEELLAFYVDCCGGRIALSSFSLSTGTAPNSFVYLGYPLDLPPRAQTLLRFLFHCAPRVISTIELMSICFPEGVQKSSCLTVLVSIVNQKALAISGFPLIRSVRGRGYCLSDGIVKN